MSPLEIKKLKVELLMVASARAQLELRIDEHLDNIERIKVSIDVQVAKEAELAAKIKEMEDSK